MGNQNQDGGLKKATQLSNITYVIVFCTIALVGAALTYLNLATVSGADFQTYKESTHKETTALVEKHSDKLSVQLKEVLSPAVAEISSMNEKLDENMVYFSNRLNDVERGVDVISNIISNGQLVTTNDFYKHKVDASQEAQGLKNEILRLQLNVQSLNSLKEDMGDFVTTDQQKEHLAAQDIRVDTLISADKSLSLQLLSIESKLESHIGNLERRVEDIEAYEF